uniref:Dynactin subunit 4 n=1 Tax=Parascaris univalens TaxID=6257 RepID=A0A914ZPA8_PARUN
MASLLSIDEVQYECSCGEWDSLNRLYFCRHCSMLKCSFCVSQELDTTFCPYCLDNVTTGEARQKKNRCSNCYRCPICGASVVLRAVSEAYHLSCNTCRWTTADSGVPDLTSATGWPEYSHQDEALLSCFLDQMKNFAIAEKADRERHKYTKRRSNLGTAFGDRFGLQTMYNRRKALLTERPVTELPKLEPTALVSELDESIFTEEELDLNKMPTLMQQVNQPLAMGRPLLPVKTHLFGRRAVRCKQCDHSLCKAEYNPNSIKFKIQVLAGNHVPDIRLSRAAELVVDQWCPVFLTVSNFSSSVAQVVISPRNEDDDHYVKCETPEISITIPNRDETVDFDDGTDKRVGATSGSIVFRKRYQVGLRLSARATEGKNKLLGLTVRHMNSSCSFEAPSGEQRWLQHSVRIKLGDVSAN